MRTYLDNLVTVVTGLLVVNIQLAQQFCLRLDPPVVSGWLDVDEDLRLEDTIPSLVTVSCTCRHSENRKKAHHGFYGKFGNDGLDISRMDLRGNCPTHFVPASLSRSHKRS
jgi:hypothetical protein